eukprot:10796458-Prorocentrum_lima.AAC.1
MDNCENNSPVRASTINNLPLSPCWYQSVPLLPGIYATKSKVWTTLLGGMSGVRHPSQNNSSFQYIA